MKAIDSLDNPLMIMKSISKNNKQNTYVIVTDIQNKNREHIIVPIYIEGEGNYNNIRIDTNKVRTVYRKNGVFKYLSDHKNYLDKLTIKRTNKIDKVQFPVSPKSSSNNSISSSSKDVNTTTKYSIQENENNSVV